MQKADEGRIPQQILHTVPWRWLCLRNSFRYRKHQNSGVVQPLRCRCLILHSPACTPRSGLVGWGCDNIQSNCRESLHSPVRAQGKYTHRHVAQSIRSFRVPLPSTLPCFAAVRAFREFLKWEFLISRCTSGPFLRSDTETFFPRAVRSAKRSRFAATVFVRSKPVHWEFFHKCLCFLRTQRKLIFYIYWFIHTYWFLHVSIHVCSWSYWPDISKTQPLDLDHGLSEGTGAV